MVQCFFFLFVCLFAGALLSFLLFLSFILFLPLPLYIPRRESCRERAIGVNPMNVGTVSMKGNVGKTSETEKGWGA